MRASGPGGSGGRLAGGRGDRRADGVFRAPRGRPGGRGRAARAAAPDALHRPPAAHREEQTAARAQRCECVHFYIVPVHGSASYHYHYYQLAIKAYWQIRVHVYREFSNISAGFSLSEN